MSEDLHRPPRRRGGYSALVPVPPPQALEMEQAVLGCILIAGCGYSSTPKECLAKCAERFKGVEMFYDLRNQEVYKAMVELDAENKPVDMITLHQRLKDKELLEQVGGIEAITQLTDVARSPANLDYYLEVVVSFHVRREVIRIGREITARSYECQVSSDHLLDGVERDVLAIRSGLVVSKTHDPKELVRVAIRTIEEMHQRQNPITGLATGFIDLDKLTGGLQEGDMVLIAARPSMGKTSLAMNIAEHVAVDQKLPVGVFSLEMTAEALMLRMLCSRARVNLRSVREGFLAERDFPKLTGAAARLSGAPLHIDDSSGMNVLQLRAKARRMFSEHGIKLLVIDYLQMLQGTRANDKREREIADISNGIKTLGKDLRIPVIAISQLNREVEREKNRKPRMSDLRESGALEADADLIGLLYQARAGDEEEETGEAERASTRDCCPMNLLLAKQRNGVAGEDVYLTFLKIFTRFESAAKIEMPNDEQGQMI